MAAPVEMDPAIAIVPSKMVRIFGTRTRWPMGPEWPPPPGPGGGCPLNPRRNSLLREAQGRHVVPDQHPVLVDTGGHLRRISAGRDDHLDAMPLTQRQMVLDDVGR